MIQVVIIAALAIGLVLLVRRGLIHVDLSFPWFAAIIVLGFASTNESFVEWAAARVGILYAPIAIIFMVIFIILGLITVLLMSFTRLRYRQIQIVRHLAAFELARQEAEAPAPVGAGPSGTGQ